jgi:FemAB-related protein (PEP-CTERM system-associated)
MPYVDSAGILASSQVAEESLLNMAIQTLEQCEGTTLELRQVEPLSSSRHFVMHCAVGEISSSKEDSVRPQFTVQTDSRKARMGLFLPGSSNEFFQSLKSKLRSQVRKPLKEGLYARIGGAELLDDFFSVLSVNMRDLGSPVHSKKFFRHVLATFEDRSNIVLVSKGNRPLACSLILGYRNVLTNPWASALKEYNFLSPNMLLYWTMLEYACDQGYEFFDFGRSTPDEGTYKFKQQWGAAPRPLYWYYVGRQEGQAGEQSQRIRLRLAVRYWKKLPVSLTRVFGPMLRKHIGL